MAFLALRETAVFDETDGAGVILDVDSGVYFSLNQIATTMVRAALRFNTLDEVVTHLRDHFDASDDTLRTDISELITELDAQRLLENGRG